MNLDYSFSQDISTGKAHGVEVTLIARATMGQKSLVKYLLTIIYLNLLLTAEENVMLLAEYSERAIYEELWGKVFLSKAFGL